MGIRLLSLLIYRLKILALIYLISLLSSCASIQTSLNTVMLDDGLVYQLQPIPESLVNTGMQALFTINKGKSQEQLLIQVEMMNSSLIISGMTVEGISLFTIEWDITSNQLNIDKNITIDSLRILAEFQFSLWPTTLLKQGFKLQGSSTQVIELANGSREINNKSRVLYTIRQVDNITTLTNIQQNYVLTIEELERWQIALKSSLNKINLDK